MMPVYDLRSKILLGNLRSLRYTGIRHTLLHAQSGVRVEVVENIAEKALSFVLAFHLQVLLLNCTAWNKVVLIYKSCNSHSQEQTSFNLQKHRPALETFLALRGWWWWISLIRKQTHTLTNSIAALPHIIGKGWSSINLFFDSFSFGF